MRPDRLLVVCGTGTEVGKTWVSVRLVEELRRRGRRVAARKPAQSFEPGATGLDADLLAAATGQDPTDVCPGHRSYASPMAPPMAAAVLGRPPFTIGDLAAECVFAEGIDVGIVETAGGVRSPQADDGDAVDLILALDPDHVVLVADAGLGTIHAVRTSVEPLEPRWPIVVLNRYDDRDELHRRNRTWLTDRYGIDVVTSPIAVAERVDLGVADHGTHVPGDMR